MAQMSITITGLNELIAKCNAPIHAAPIRKAFTESALDLEAKSVSLAPRLTGNLQRSILHKIDGAAIPKFAHVGMLGGGPVGKHGQRYGVYVHEGTKRMRARPFLRNALSAMAGRVQGYFDAAARSIESAWGR